MSAAPDEPGVPTDAGAGERLRGRDLALALGVGIPAGILLAVVVGVTLAAFGVDLAGGAGIAVSAVVYLPIGACAWYFCAVRRGGGLRALGLTRPTGEAVVLMFPVAFGLTLIEGMITLPFARLIGEDRNPQFDFLAPGDSMPPARLAWLVVAAVVIAPVVEEIVFRGLVYRFLRQRTGVAWSAIVSGALFSAVHGYLVVLPALFVFGVALSLVTERFASIVPAIVLHATKNALALGVLFVTLS